MVQRVSVGLVDDIDGGEAVETVTFGLDGATYEIDLSAENSAKLRSALAEWIGAGRRGGRKAVATRSAKGGNRNSDAAAIRAWASANGHKVSERGRIPADVREAYEAAN